MSVDRVSNMLSSIKNAAMTGNPYVEVPYTKECEEVAKNLKTAGFIKEVKVFKESGDAFKSLHIDLTYENDLPKITDISRLSKPGRRVYKGYRDIKSIAGGYGVLIVSTSRGIMTGDEARNKKLGGELICSVK